MKKILILPILALTYTGFAQSFETFKLNGNQPVSNQSFIYALPQTCFSVTVEVTKTTIRKGVYADYAEKYLQLTNVPLKDLHSYAVTGIKVQALAEADPAQYYSVTCKTVPENLLHLFSASQSGVILNFADTWNNLMSNKLSDVNAANFSDPLLLEKTFTEKVDTTYESVMKDSIMQKIPVFKKQRQAKTQEEIIEATANQMIKTRRHKIKVLRGEYDFHPDGAALKVMVEELSKYEASLLALFAGTKITEKQYYAYNFVPQNATQSKELCYFSSQKGILTEKGSGSQAIIIQLATSQESAKGISPDKGKNILYMRAPIMSDVIIRLDDKGIFSGRFPVYQFGSVTIMPLNLN